jgi:phosphotransacetylase
MSIEFNTFEDLLRSVGDLPAMPVAVIDADEKHVLEGVCEAAAAGFIDPILIGDEPRIRRKLETMTGAGHFRILHAPAADAMAEKGVELIEKGEVKGLIKGHIHTDAFLHPILLHHLQGKKRISHVFLADLSTYPKLLYITDAAININPDLTTKMHIVQNAVDFSPHGPILPGPG